MPRSKHRRKKDKKVSYHPGRKRPGTAPKRKEEDTTVLVQGSDPDRPLVELNRRNRMFFYTVGVLGAVFVIVVALRIFGVF